MLKTYTNFHKNRGVGLLCVCSYFRQKAKNGNDLICHICNITKAKQGWH